MHAGIRKALYIAGDASWLHVSIPNLLLSKHGGTTYTQHSCTDPNKPTCVCLTLAKPQYSAVNYGGGKTGRNPLHPSVYISVFVNSENEQPEKRTFDEQQICNLLD